jgi:FKBP-type peptidyl-prolyl cis-trans isomerase
MGSPVKDRSGKGLPPKAERRALGKAAARKRAVARRRRELLNRVLQIVGPIVAVGLIIGVVWLFGRNAGSDTATPQASTSPTVAAEPEPEPTWTLPAGLDPQLGTEPEVTAGEGTVSELKVTTLVAGTGAPLVNGQSVTVNYVGVTYATGEEFDASWNRGQPFQFTLGGNVIQGWNQGLLGVPIGSRVQLDIPSALAYGDDGQPAGDLRFVVDVLDAS